MHDDKRTDTSIQDNGEDLSILAAEFEDTIYPMKERHLNQISCCRKLRLWVIFESK